MQEDRGDSTLVGTERVEFFLEHLADDEVRSLRDRIAKAEAELTYPIWEHRLARSKQIKELKDKCEQGSHALTIVLNGQSRNAAAADEKRVE